MIFQVYVVVGTRQNSVFDISSFFYEWIKFRSKISRDKTILEKLDLKFLSKENLDLKF